MLSAARKQLGQKWSIFRHKSTSSSSSSFSRRSYSSRKYTKLVWPLPNAANDFPDLKYLVDHADWNVSFSATSHKPKVYNPDPIRWKKALSRSSDREIIQEFEKIYSSRTPIPVESLASFAISYGKIGKAGRALNIYLDQVDNCRLKPTALHLTALLNAFGRSYDSQRALALYALMSAHHVNGVAVITLIDALSKSRQIEVIEAIWKDWRENTSEWPEVNFYTTVAEASISNKRFGLLFESEKQLRKDYKEAYASGKLSKMSASHITPKHVAHISGMLIRYWLPIVQRVMPDNDSETLQHSLEKWAKVRPVLPGAPLSHAEIEAWLIQIDVINLINDKYGHFPADSGKPSNDTSTPSVDAAELITRIENYPALEVSEKRYVPPQRRNAYIKMKDYEKYKLSLNRSSSDNKAK